MKRVLLSATLCVLVSMSFAQKKAVKEAKSSMGSKNYTEAREFIKPALTDPETANDPETWKVAGDIENAAFDGENTKQMIGQQPNEEVMYTALLASYDPYVKADELGELPDAKGKIKNKYRKDITSIMKTNHPYFSNGGVYFYNKGNYKTATDAFLKYWDMSSLTMFVDDKNAPALKDSTSQIIKYYAVSSATLDKNNDLALKLLLRIKSEQFYPNSFYNESQVYELISGQYLTLGDTINYVKSLEEGVTKYPKNNYFVTNLINYYIINKNEPESALSYLDVAIKNDPTNLVEFTNAKAQIYATQNKFEDAITTYETSLSAEPNSEKALEGLAVVYIVQAQDLKAKSGETRDRALQKELDDKANIVYKKALPLLEKYRDQLEARDAEKQEIKQAYVKLRNVYYNLSMNAEYEKANTVVEGN